MMPKLIPKNTLKHRLSTTSSKLAGNLRYLDEFPDYKAVGRKLTVDDLIYVTPEFRDKFEGKVPARFSPDEKFAEAMRLLNAI